MASNGETYISKLITAVRQAYPGRYEIQTLATVCELQQERLRALEREIFDRCGDLRQRVATIEQSRQGIR